MEGWQLFPARCQRDQSAFKDDQLGWPLHRSGAVTRPGREMMEISVKTEAVGWTEGARGGAILSLSWTGAGDRLID